MSRDPHWYAATMRKPATAGSFSTFMIFVKAIAWLVSSPMMPTFVSANAPQTVAAAAAARNNLFIF